MLDHSSPVGTYYDENGPSGQTGLIANGIQPRVIINHPEYTDVAGGSAFDVALVFLKSCVSKSAKATTIPLATAEGGQGASVG
jgi:hypothetical protein